MKCTQLNSRKQQYSKLPRNHIDVFDSDTDACIGRFCAEFLKNERMISDGLKESRFLYLR